MTNKNSKKEFISIDSSRQIGLIMLGGSHGMTAGGGSSVSTFCWHKRERENDRKWSKAKVLQNQCPVTYFLKQACYKIVIMVKYINP